MGGSLSVDLAGLRTAAAGQGDIAERAMLVAAELKAAIASVGAAWGSDKPGKTFEEFYLPSSEQVVEIFDQMVSALDELGTGLVETAGAFEARDLDSGNHISPRDPFTWNPVTAELAATSPGFVPAGRPAEHVGSLVPEQREVPPSSADSAEPPGDGRTVAAEPDRDRQPDSEDAQHPRLPESAGPEISGPEQAGQVPVLPPAGPANQRTPEGKPAEPHSAVRPASASISPATGNGRQTGATPWSSAPPKDTGSPPRRAVSAPQSPSRAGEPLPPRPMAPQPPPRRKPEQSAPARPGRRTGSKAAPGKPEKARPATRPEPVPARATTPEALRIAYEMAARHGLSTVGFESAGIGEPAVRELAAALDQVLTTHHVLDLRVVEIADISDGSTACIRWDRVGGDGGPVADTARLVLDRAKIVEPLPEPAGETVRRVAGPIHAAVIRELGRALDAMGGHAAQRRVQRTLIRYFVENTDPQAPRNSLGRLTADYRKWRHTLPGAGADIREFDPAALLVEAFAEVVTGPPAPGSAAASLHRLLVETAAGAR